MVLEAYLLFSVTCLFAIQEHYHGEYPYRSGSTKQQLRGSALTKFLVRKTGYRRDAVPVDRVAVSDLAGTFYRAGYIEAWGRGIQKICEACEELGAPMPEYILIGDDLTVKLSAFESAGINVPKRIVEREIKNLRESGRITRKGGRRYG